MRPIPYHILCAACICKGMTDIAILFFLKCDVDGRITYLLQQLHYMMQGYTRSTRYVQHFTNSSIRHSCTNICFDHITNVGEVACLHPISIDTDGSMIDNGFTKAMEAHIWSLTRSIHSKVAQRDRRHSK